MTPSELNTITIMAFRYALGRQTYTVTELVDFAIKYRNELSQDTRALMHREIAESNRLRFFSDADKPEWERLDEALSKVKADETVVSISVVNRPPKAAKKKTKK